MGETSATRDPLAAGAALDRFAAEGDGVRAAALEPRSIASIAFGPDAAGAREAVERGLGMALPAIGESASAPFAGGSTVLGLQRDQWFVLTPAADAPVEAVREAVGERPAVTDQSDAWVALVMEGPRATLALERTCRLDLHAEAFGVGRVARTAMEHIATVIHREGAERFVLLAPRSSAEWFARAVATSVRNVS